MSACAAATDNAELLAKVDFTKSDLARLLDPHLDDEAQAIYDLATAMLTEQAALQVGTPERLADYGVTVEKLRALQTRITAYSAVVTSPRNAQVKKKGATEAIARHFANVDRIFNDILDRLALQFETTHPDFFLGVQQCAGGRGSGRDAVGAGRARAEACASAHAAGGVTHGAAQFACCSCSRTL